MLNQYNNLIKKEINNNKEVKTEYNNPIKRKYDHIPSEDEEVNITKKLKNYEDIKIAKIYMEIKNI